MKRDEFEAELEFERRDARLGWWGAFVFGLALGIALASALWLVLS